MNRDVYIISSDAFAKESSEITEYFNKKEIKTKCLSYKRMTKPPEITPELENSNIVKDILEKNYEKDNNMLSAGIVRSQKPQLNKILSSIPEKSVIYLCEEYIPEYFYLKKHFFRNSLNFFAFGKVIEGQPASVNRFALDIGIKIDNFKSYDQQNNSFGNIFSSFNGHIAIDPPPDAIPYSHLGYFRSPKNFVRALISFLDSYYKNKRHPLIKILCCSKDNEFYNSSQRAEEFAGFLGKRCEKIESVKHLEKNCAVITWSTTEFFRFLNSGFKAVPATRCAASFIFTGTGIGERIVEENFKNGIEALSEFYRERSL